MTTIIGIRSSSFKGEDGVMITGKNIYLTEPLKKGEGHSAERVFLTDEKLRDRQYDPKVGDKVHIDWLRLFVPTSFFKMIPYRRSL